MSLRYKTNNVGLGRGILNTVIGDWINDTITNLTPAIASTIIELELPVLYTEIRQLGRLNVANQLTFPVLKKLTVKNHFSAAAAPAPLVPGANIFVNEDYSDPFRAIPAGRIPIGGAARLAQYNQDDFFANMQLLEEIILHNVTKISLRDIFQNNSFLKIIEIPYLTKIEHRFFPLENGYIKEIRFNNVGQIIIKKFFSKFTNLENIELHSLESIDNDIFYDCTNLKQLGLFRVKTINNRLVNPFQGSNKLEKIQLLDLQIIDNPIFANLQELKEIYLNKVQVINADDIFQGCLKLEKINLSSLQNITTLFIGTLLKLNEIKLSSVKTITQPQIFQSCPNLKIIYLNQLLIIDNDILKNLNSFEVALLDSVTTITVDNVFEGSPNLKFIYLPKLKKISDNMLNNCKKLEKIYLNTVDELTNQDKELFKDYLQLKEIYLNSLTKINSNDIFVNCPKLIILILTNLKKIKGYNIIKNCPELFELYLNNLENITGNNIFVNCSKLVILQLNKLLRINGSDIFKDCFSLVNINLNQVTNIEGQHIFNNCENLMIIELKNVESIIGTNSIIISCNSLQVILLHKLKNIQIDNNENIFSIVSHNFRPSIIISQESENTIKTFINNLSNNKINVRFLDINNTVIPDKLATTTQPTTQPLTQASTQPATQPTAISDSDQPSTISIINPTTIFVGLSSYIITNYYQNTLNNQITKYKIIGMLVILIISEMTSKKSIFSIISSILFKIISSFTTSTQTSTSTIPAPITPLNGGHRIFTSSNLFGGLQPTNNKNIFSDIKVFLESLVEETVSIIIEWKKNPNIDYLLLVENKKQASIQNEISKTTETSYIYKEEIIDIQKSKYYKELKELQNKLSFKLSPKLLNKAESIIRKIEENNKSLDKEYKNIIEYNKIINGKSNIFSGIKTINTDLINDIVINYSDAYKASLHNYKKLVQVENKHKQKLEYIINL